METYEGKAVLEEDMENLLTESYYEGTRTLLTGKKGSKAVLVPPEDADYLEKIEKVLNGACYNGERVVLKGKEGSKVGIVPLEDLDLLEKLAP